MTAENSADRVARHVVSTRYEDLPPEAVGKVKTFLLDTVGVGIAGTSGAQVEELKAVARSWGDKPEATVWLTGEDTSSSWPAVVFFGRQTPNSLTWAWPDEWLVTTAS